MYSSTSHATGARRLLRLLPLLATILVVPGSATALTALISAYDGEFEHLLAAVDTFEPHRVERVNGVRFHLGAADGEPVVMFKTGIGLVNAAMTLQLALSHYPITRVLFSGTAGGVDSRLAKGDVTVAGRWHYTGYGARFAPDPNSPSGYRIPDFMRGRISEAHLGNFYPYAPKALRSGMSAPSPTPYFPSDPDLLALARRVARTIDLKNAAGEPAHILIGTVGGSGFAYNDEPALRDFAAEHWNTAAVDMESAALAQVAWSNGVPLLSVRGISDLVANEDAQEFETYRPVAERNAARFVAAMLAAATADRRSGSDGAGGCRAACPPPPGSRTADVIDELGLRYLEGESGWFAERTASEFVVTGPDGSALPATSSIYYLLTREHPVNYLHWLASEDTHILVEGGPVDYFVFGQDGSAERIRVGRDLERDQRPALTVPARSYKALRLAPEADYALLVNVLAPAWTPERVRIGVPPGFLDTYRQSAPWLSPALLESLRPPSSPSAVDAAGM